MKWSDGKPLTAEDVRYSLTIGRQDKAADRISLTAANSNIAGVARVGANKVAIRFKQVDSTFLGSQLPTVPIVPKHVWSKVKNIVNFANPNPVGSGPVQPRHALQRAVVPALEEPELLGEGPAADRLRAADLYGVQRRGPAPDRQRPADWTHNFVPNVESAYMAKHPKNFHNAYLTTGAAGQPHVQHNEYPTASSPSARA